MFLTKVTAYQIPCIARTIFFRIFAPSPVPIKLPIYANLVACILRPREESHAMRQKSTIATPSRMDGLSIRRLYCASCVLHLVVILPCIICVLRVLRALRVPVMCLSFRLGARHYRATRAARFLAPIEPIVDLVGGRRQRE